jgi:hypothetical protein
MSCKTSKGFGSRGRFRIIADFIPGFPVKLNFDHLSPVTIHFQPSSVVVFGAGGAVSSLLFDSEFYTALSSALFSLSLSELFSLSEKT